MTESRRTVGFRLTAACACALTAMAGALAADDPATAEARRTDLTALRDNYVRMSRAFTPDAQRAALEHIASLDARADDITNAQFLIAIARTTALADNGHDGWHPGDDAWLPKRRAPLRFAWFPDALVVARAAREYQDLLGARVTALDGRGPDELFERLRTLAGGPDNYRRWNLGLFLERAELLHALGLADSPARFTLSVVLRDGRETARVVVMIPQSAAPRGAMPGRLLATPAYGNEVELGWSGVAPGTDVPLYLQDPDRLFRIADLPTIGASYLQFRSHYGTETEPIEDFIRAARARLAETKPQHLIVDLRFDGGGNIDPTVDFFNSLAAAVPGRIYVIVSRHTFSAGIVAAALVRQSAGDRTMIVGEPVGDRLRFWSEGRSVCLPESKYCVQVTDGLWDLVNGCAQEPGCYGDAYRVKVPDLDPDLAAPWTAGSWLAGTDPAMTAIEAQLWSCKSCRPEPADAG
ncbi:MAG TPA: hypothetical protein VGA24_09025 [Steroidobacteraceae bacterium]